LLVVLNVLKVGWKPSRVLVNTNHAEKLCMRKAVSADINKQAHYRQAV
jgi:hypothetical protein